MTLHPKYYDILGSDSWLSSNFKDRHHILWYLPVFLVHEIAHLVWSDRVLGDWLEAPEKGLEPCLVSSHTHPENESDELGEAEEHFLYQGRFRFYAHRNGVQAPPESLLTSGNTQLL
jgi:hypothetical protein